MENGNQEGSCGSCSSSCGTPEDVELQETLDGITHKIVVLSGKGGVGKSSVAANLAVSLSKSGKRTGILDTDLHGPSIPTILGAGEQRLIQIDGKIQPLEFSDTLKVMSVGFMLEKQSDPLIWRGAAKHGVIKQFISSVNWGDLDYLVVDCPPGTGDEPLSVIQLLGEPDGAVIVTTPQDLALVDVRKSVTFCHEMNLDVIGVVENMSGFACPHCGEVVDVFKTGGGERMAEEMGVPFLGRIPLDPAMVSAADDGKPFVEHNADAPASGAMQNIFEKVIRFVEE